MDELSFDTVVIISAVTEWRIVRKLFPDVEGQYSPLGEWWITESLPAAIGRPTPIVFFHGGWGKIAAAASTQYVIDRWKPKLLINLGTCGGFEGEIERGAIILADRTLVYDIIEQMGDFDQAVAHYTTEIDLSWLENNNLDRKMCLPVKRTLLVSGDRDLIAEEIPQLKARYGAVAGDWESGAIAYVAARNQTRLLILRGVSDLVGSSGGEAYDNYKLFEDATASIMQRLIESLPCWLAMRDGGRF
jgi:adenosylhomocysteine nucleosidase